MTVALVAAVALLALLLLPLLVVAVSHGLIWMLDRWTRLGGL